MNNNYKKLQNSNSFLRLLIGQKDLKYSENVAMYGKCYHKYLVKISSVIDYWYLSYTPKQNNIDFVKTWFW